jgi:N-acetylglucosaminyldiphosphoundecaprenol N-acetyl-beta-D-mannosaminyltransferase
MVKVSSVTDQTQRTNGSCGTNRRADFGDTEPDNLSREVFGILGLPVDSSDLSSVLRKIDFCARHAVPLLISTPNVNFLIASRTNQHFRDSVIMSDLCLPDGMPIVWISRLLGVPIKNRISGADLFDSLKSEIDRRYPLKVFLFGGTEGAANAVCNSLNSRAGGLKCVGVLNPGFGSVDEMSNEEIIENINSSGADLLAVFLGAAKAQAWLLRNRHRLIVPILGQFGATINFQAGLIMRAPKFLQRVGFEWLWRIKEEPYLWRRYWGDGLKLLRIILTEVLPLMLYASSRYLTRWMRIDRVSAEFNEEEQRVIITLSGDLTEAHVADVIWCFRRALRSDKQILIDMSNARHVDSRFFGLFLMVYKQVLGHHRTLKFAGVTSCVRRMFSLNGFDFLLL